MGNGQWAMGRHFGFRPWSKFFCLRVQHRRGWGSGFRQAFAARDYTPCFCEIWSQVRWAEFGATLESIWEHPVTSSSKFFRIKYLTAPKKGWLKHLKKLFSYWAAKQNI